MPARDPAAREADPHRQPQNGLAAAAMAINMDPTEWGWQQLTDK